MFPCHDLLRCLIAEMSLDRAYIITKLNSVHSLPKWIRLSHCHVIYTVYPWMILIETKNKMDMFRIGSLQTWSRKVFLRLSTSSSMFRRPRKDYRFIASLTKYPLKIAAIRYWRRLLGSPTVIASMTVRTGKLCDSRGCSIRILLKRTFIWNHSLDCAWQFRSVHFDLLYLDA